MARNEFKILDSDMHLMEPVDLWECYLDSRYRAEAPRGLTSENVRDLRLAHPDGRYWGLPATHNRNSVHHQGHNYRQNQGIYQSHAERGWTARVQLEAMDIEGTDVALLYPTRGLQVLSEPNMEPDFAAALARAYNDWLYDFCEKNPERLLGGRHDLAVRYGNSRLGSKALRKGAGLSRDLHALHGAERPQLA